MTEAQGTAVLELLSSLYICGRLLVFAAFLGFGAQLYFAFRKGNSL